MVNLTELIKGATPPAKHFEFTQHFDMKEEVLTEFQQKFGETNIIISGISKGEAKSIFQDLTKEMNKIGIAPKQLRIDF